VSIGVPGTKHSGIVIRRGMNIFDRRKILCFSKMDLPHNISYYSAHGNEFVKYFRSHQNSEYYKQILKDSDDGV
jgi:hypothetical protein